MSLSLYDISAPLFLSGLKNLSVLLDKALASGIPESEFLEARLAPDMLPLPKQVQLVSDTSKGAIARLADKPFFEPQMAGRKWKPTAEELEEAMAAKDAREGFV